MYTKHTILEIELKSKKLNTHQELSKIIQDQQGKILKYQQGKHIKKILTATKSQEISRCAGVIYIYIFI